MKIKLRIAAIIIAAALLCACGVPADTETNLNALCGLSMQGRMGGTQGGSDAADYIEEQLNQTGVETRRQEFGAEIFLPESLETSLTVLGEEKRKCVLYEDYAPARISAGASVSGEVTFDRFDENLNKKVLVTDKAFSLASLEQQPLAVLIKSESLIKYMSARKNGIPIFCISDELYSRLSGGTTASLSMRAEFGIGTFSNVIGRIKGKDSTRAIVVSAHFDGLGYDKAGLFKGAVDNASGTAALLACARLTKEKLNGKTPERDIVFAFFDGEEQGLLGSGTFALQNVYSEIDNINIDCIEKGENITVQCAAESAELAKEVSGFITGSQTGDITGLSDNFSFSAAGHRAVMLTTLTAEDKGSIHTTGDVKDDVDALMLLSLADALSNYITQNE